MRTVKRLFSICALVFITMSISSSALAQAASYEQLAPYVSEVQSMVLPSSGIVALGEATHGNREFTELKQQVFKMLVEQHGARVFVLEGDFGGCQRVNAYLQTGEGTPETAAAEIGFAIYKTEEMVALLQWMREYNADKDADDQIRFYGFDMQRYDNNKSGLFDILQRGAPDLHAEYESALSGFTDESMYDIEESDVRDAIEALEVLYAELTSRKDAIVNATSEKEYALACEYAKCIMENTQLRIADNYGTLRDGFMAEHVKWIYEYEAEHYDTQLIFITGHNGHIGKTTATFGTEKVMGEILDAWYGTEYYAIGTEFYESTFLAPDAETGERKAFTIQNSGDERLAVLLHASGLQELFLNIDEAADDATLVEYMQTAQAMSSIGEAFHASYTGIEMAYTQQLPPQPTYNGLIFFDSCQPSTMLPAP